MNHPIHSMARRQLGLLAALLLLPAAVFADEHEGLFIFGDSLSDPGNVWQLTGQTVSAPYAPVPAAPYDIGGHHFSNGKTWAERLAQRLMMPKGGKSALHRPGMFGNYAFGGARARPGSGSAAPDALTQVGLFLGDYTRAPGDALYVIQFGGNDVRDALVAIAPGTPAAQAAAQAILVDAATGTINTIQTLYFAGARRFLVVNAPNLEHAPAVRLAGAGRVAGLLSGLYNGGLEGALQALEAALPGVTLQRFDLGGFIDELVATGGAQGIDNVSDSCLTFFTDVDPVCAEPDRYLFWDGIHPTAAGHGLLAKRVAAGL
jgi:phospholipase/lecithinase/hemolysin